MGDLAALPWPGGKSARANNGIGHWIAKLLPDDAHCYVEPYGGMWGVGLLRAPAPQEVINDTNGDLVNWWTVVRDRNADLVEMLRATPLWARDLFLESIEGVRSESDPLRRAYWFTLRIAWSFNAYTDTPKPFYTYPDGSRTTRRWSSSLPAGCGTSRSRTVWMRWTCEITLDYIDHDESDDDPDLLYTTSEAKLRAKIRRFVQERRG